MQSRAYPLSSMGTEDTTDQEPVDTTNSFIPLYAMETEMSVHGRYQIVRPPD